MKVLQDLLFAFSFQLINNYCLLPESVSRECKEPTVLPKRVTGRGVCAREEANVVHDPSAHFPRLHHALHAHRFMAGFPSHTNEHGSAPAPPPPPTCGDARQATAKNLLR